MITCKICNHTFDKIIPWQHLKTHDITTADYKKNYGEVYSQETKQKHAQRIPYNKGIEMSAEQKEKLKKKALERNQKWRETDSNPNKGSKRSAETKEKIKQARAKQVITSEQVQKALDTKRKNGYDLAVFRGKKHTERSKQKIAIAANNANKRKIAASHDRIQSMLNEYNFTLNNSLFDTTLDLTCNVCNSSFTFTKQYFSQSKTHSQLCPTCFPRNIVSSKGEREIYDFVKSLNNTAISNYRVSYHSKELDIFIPNQNIGIEYHGLYWHSEIYKDTKYHYEKYKTSYNNEIKLIQIFEDEWQQKPDIVKSRIKSLLNLNETIYARKCTIKEIGLPASSFLETYHIQGKGRSNVKIGLFFKEELVAVMTFLKGDISKNLVDWELNRFCTKSNITVVGGASKLFNYFIQHYNPDRIISFADLRWSSEDAVYLTLGFTLDHISPPNYWYFRPNELKRYHRFSLRKPEGSLISEKELRKQEGWLRIYDCGSAKFIWSKENPN